MNNHPFTLKTHTYCSFERFLLKNNQAYIERCNAPTEHIMFCTEHAYAQRLLDLAAERGYPEMQPVNVDPKTKETYGRIIGRGIHSWEVYAERVSERHAQVMVARLRKIKPVRKGVA